MVISIGVALAQSPAFEAASIKANKSLNPGGGLNIQPARIKVINSSVKFCIQMAWHVQPFQVSGGPGWTDTDRFDIEAVAAKPFQPGEYRAMLQTLLLERFGLATHRETVEKPGYILVAAKNGPKLQPTKEELEHPSSMFSRTVSGDVTFKATGTTMTSLAEVLSSRLGKIIVNQTGIEGKFDLDLQYTPDPSDPPMGKGGMPEPPRPADGMTGASIFTVLQEKAGLKLEARKVPVETIVIDRVSRPSEN